MLQISIAQRQMKAKIHSFQTMYILGGGRCAENGLLGGESLTRELEQNGFVFIESCNVNLIYRTLNYQTVHLS